MSLFVVPEKEDLFPQQKTGYNAWLMPKVMLALACPALTKKGRHRYWESALEH